MNGLTYQDVVAQIKDRLDIVDVVSKYVILKKSGGNYWGCCPFHNEKTPSFSVSPAKQIYKCFGCGEGGDVLSFLMKINNQSFAEVVKEQAEILGIELPNNFDKSKDNKDIKEQIYSCMKNAAEFYKKTLLENKTSEAYQYLANRGITDENIETYRLGFAPNAYDALQKFLKVKHNEEIQEKAGLIIKRENGNGFIDRFRNRITIPIFDEKGNIVAFGARAIEAGQNPKYLNSPETLVYNKSHVLYGLYHAKEAIKEKDSIVIMEGYFDVISAQVNGVKNAVGACGTALTDSHVKLISRYTQSRKIYLAFDTDKAGQMATKRGAEVIKEAFSGLGNIKQFDESFASTSENTDRYSCELRVVVPPEGKDPDEFIRENGAEAYAQVLRQAPLLVDFQIESVLKAYQKGMSPVEKSAIVKEVLPYLLEIGNNIVRDEYVKIVSSRLDITENSLQKELLNSSGKGLNNTYSQKPKPQTQLAPIVKKSLNISEKAQKNLLSMYLINESSYNIQTLNSILKEVEYTNDTLIIVKDTIDKLVGRVNNVKELIETLYTEFAEDYEVKDIITDLIYLSDSFKNLSDKDFKIAINENIETIKSFKEKELKSHLRSQYKQVNDDDIKAIEQQIQLKELLKNKNKLRTGDN
ncbi:MAG: DNA primase [Candidatus Gastranaerophilaceae bacterium]